MPTQRLFHRFTGTSPGIRQWGGLGAHGVVTPCTGAALDSCRGPPLHAARRGYRPRPPARALRPLQLQLAAVDGATLAERRRGHHVQPACRQGREACCDSRRWRKGRRGMRAGTPQWTSTSGAIRGPRWVSAPSPSRASQPPPEAAAVHGQLRLADDCVSRRTDRGLTSVPHEGRAVHGTKARLSSAIKVPQ